jgi:BASS family bile acid:Na+ symporter
MNLATLIRMAFPVSIGLIVFSLGLRCMLQEATFVLSNRGLLLRSVLAMNVVQPLIALLLVSITHLHPAVKIALVALAVSPVPPMLPTKALKLVDRASYVYGELVATALLAIVLVPATMALLGAMAGHDARVPPAAVARIIGLSVLLPLGLGMLVRHFWPAFAARASVPASATGTAVLAAAALVAWVTAWPAISLLIGNGTLLVCLLFAFVGLVVGHALGGPDPDHRTVLALSTTARHPGVAIAIGATAFPDQKLVPAAVVLYLLASTIAAAPYIAWRKRLHVTPPNETPA